MRTIREPRTMRAIVEAASGRGGLLVVILVRVVGLREVVERRVRVDLGRAVVECWGAFALYLVLVCEKNVMVKLLILGRHMIVILH